jgi:hypothetical protein
LICKGKKAGAIEQRNLIGKKGKCRECLEKELGIVTAQGIV